MNLAQGVRDQEMGIVLPGFLTQSSLISFEDIGSACSLGDCTIFTTPVSESNGPEYVARHLLMSANSDLRVRYILFNYSTFRKGLNR